VLAGDFNVCPADIDVYDPVAFVGDTHVTPEERARFEALLDAGTVDAYRHPHPDEVGFTWWDYRQGHFHRKLALRIDAFLVKLALAERIAACAIDRGYRKDPSRPITPRC
jgi:exodeoxyribonuclease-3